jgi:protease I
MFGPGNVNIAVRGGTRPPGAAPAGVDQATQVDDEGVRDDGRQHRTGELRAYVCDPHGIYNQNMDLKGKRIALFVDVMYQEMEVWYPLYRFREAGAEVLTIGAEAGKTYTSKLGYPVVSDRSYDVVNAGDFDGVIVPGGYAPDFIRRHAAANSFVAETNAQGKLVAAICHGPWVLCSAHGLLRGRRATSFFAIKDDVVNAGAHWEDAEVVVDANLVTSRKPDDLPAFCREAMAVVAKGPARG